MCKADPPGWHYLKSGDKIWYPGGVNYNKPCVPIDGLYNEQPIQTCKYCGRKI